MDGPHEAATTTLPVYTKTIFSPTKSTNLITVSVHKMAYKNKQLCFNKNASPTLERGERKRDVYPTCCAAKLNSWSSSSTLWKRWETLRAGEKDSKPEKIPHIEIPK